MAELKKHVIPTVAINQNVNRDAYSVLKFHASKEGRNVKELVDEAVVLYADVKSKTKK